MSLECAGPPHRRSRAPLWTLLSSTGGTPAGTAYSRKKNHSPESQQPANQKSLTFPRKTRCVCLRTFLESRARGQEGPGGMPRQSPGKSPHSWATAFPCGMWDLPPLPGSAAVGLGEHRAAQGVGTGAEGPAATCSFKVIRDKSQEPPPTPQISRHTVSVATAGQECCPHSALM